VIEFDDHFDVPATPDRVMARFMDVPAVARCIPGVELQGLNEAGEHLGAMTVAFGPKRLRFEGKLRCEFDPVARTGLLTGGGMAAGRGAAVRVRTEFQVTPAPGTTQAAPASRVTIRSRTDLQGVLAAFAATGGTVLARQVMQEFAAALAAQLAQEAQPAGEPSSPGGAPVKAEPVPAGAPVPLSAGALLWRTLVGWLQRLGARRPDGAIRPR
jgi:uncharacterized protein